MYFEADTAFLDAAQALCVALPAAGLPVLLQRFGGRGWSLVAPLSVVATVVAITVAAESAEVLTWIALLLVPPGCALAFGWAAHGARPWMALLVVPLLAAALIAPDDPLGRVGRLALIVGSCVTLGRLLAGAAPLTLLKAGVVAMATIDAVFIFGDFFGAQNDQFNAAAPAGLPRLQVADIGNVSTDYGDFFVAGLVGGILAAERRPQALAAVATFVAAQAFNQLFLVVDSLPGTIPPAVGLARLRGHFQEIENAGSSCDRRVASRSMRDVRAHSVFRYFFGALLLVLAAMATIATPSSSAQASGLKYFGYFAARITPSGGDHLAEVANRSNLNWVQISDPDRYAPEVLDGCKPRGCLISTGHEFFTGCDSVHAPTCALHPDYAARWGRLADAVRSRIDKVAAFYLMDEPQWRGATPAELHTAATTIKATFPGMPVMMVEAGPQVTPSLQIPTSVDWVGFDWYCQPFADVEKTLATLTTRVHPHQSLFLVPEAAPLEACGGAAGHATDAEIAALQYQYLQLAEANPRVIGLLAFGFWTSGYGSAQLPQTVAAHEYIYSRIAPAPAPSGAPVKIKSRRVRVSDRAVIRVRLKCPAANTGGCAGSLSLSRKSKRARPVGSREFSLAPAAKEKVRVRIVRDARRGILRQARRKRGIKLRVTAATAAGEAHKTVTARR